MPKRRVVRYDVLRALAALMVAGAHFDTALPQYLNFANYPRPLLNGLGTYLFDGSLAVAIFFMLSGFFTYKTLEQEDFVATSYIKKRLGRLLIPVWIAWPIAVVIRLFSGKLTVDSGWKLLLTIFGLDGYQGTYFHLGGFDCVGEWYTGGVLLVTLLWPLLRLALKKQFWLTVFVVFVGEISFGLVLPMLVPLDSSSLNPLFWRSPLVCVATFLLGLCAYKLFKSTQWKQPNSIHWLLPLALIAAGQILHHQRHILSSSLAFQATAFAYFCIAEACSYISLPWLAKTVVCKVGRAFVASLARISYQFYLFQHVIIYLVLGAAATALAGQTIYTFTCIELTGICFGLTAILALLTEWLETRIRTYMSAAINA